MLRGRVSAIASMSLAVLVVAGCGGNEKTDPTDFRVTRDEGLVFDASQNDLGEVPDGLPSDKEGPEIEILAPEEDEIVIGTVLRVRAQISDPEGIDAQSVGLTLQGQDAEPIPMGLGNTQGVYEALIDVTKLNGVARLWVVAADLLGNENSAIRTFKRDAGPVILFRSPAEDGRHKGSVSIQVVVGDEMGVTEFEVRLGSTVIPMQKTTSDAQQAVYVGTIEFDDPKFGLSLSGKQVLTASAANANGARNTVRRTFFVDDEGPTIKILTQTAGQLIGGIVEIEVGVDDLAGVLSSSVRCVVGNELTNRVVQLVPDPLTANKFAGRFDTRTLDDHHLWPVMSFRAADRLGNESHRDIEVGLDNGPPVVALDPDENFTAAKKKEAEWQCSHQFDPMGGDAADDLDLVPQLADLRVRVEDRGNFVPSADWVPLAGTDPASVSLYVLPGAVGKPLVVDSDGDGWCDEINPQVIPIGSELSTEHAVAVNLSPVGANGTADYTPVFYPLTDPLKLYLPQLMPEISWACDSPGEAEKPPLPICDTTPITRVIHYSAGKLPAIWSIPPIAGDALKCMGLQFDFGANEIPGGWTCLASSARDELGNLGVAEPIRVYVDHQALFKAPVPSGLPDPPNCSGTLDKSTGQVNDTPCKIRRQISGKACTQDSQCCSDNNPKGCGRFEGLCTKAGGATQGFCRAKWAQEYPEWEVREQ